MVICFKSKAIFIVEHSAIPDDNNDDRLRYHSRRFRRCWGVKCRRLKGRRERNNTSAKRGEIVESTTGGNEEAASVHFVDKFFTATTVASTFIQLFLYVAGETLLLCMTTQLHAFRQCDHVRSHSIAYKVFENAVMA
ncbi:hypothetical protein TNCV_1384041 [Trichonephila clavipes]|nr:hypothetical protein TNCV_1384041 [Trichonephila clavipes]